MIIPPKIRAILILLIFLSCIFSCSFDTDAKYLPSTQVGYLIYQETTTSEKKVMKMEGDYIEKNWQESWEVTDNSLGDLASFENELWVSNILTKEILQIDPSSGFIHHRKKLNDITPHYICVGESQILIADTSQNLLSFWNRKTDELVRRSLSSSPTLSTYRSQKFFVVYNETKVLIYQERALAMLDSLDFGAKITDIQTDNGLFTVVFGQKDSKNFQGLIDYNTNQFNTPPEETSIIKARYSPFSRQVYGNEFLVDHILKPDRRISFVQNIQDFEVDFFEGNMYFVRNDSLSVFSHWTRETRNIIPFSHELKDAFFYIK